MQHLNTYCSCVDTLPSAHCQNMIIASQFPIIENREIDGGVTLFNIFLYTDTSWCIIPSITYMPFCEWIALGCLRQHLKISTEVIKPCELRITLLPTHAAA